MAEPTVQELQQQLTDLNKKLKEAGGLGIDLQEAFRNAGTDTKKLNEYAKQLNKQYEDLVDNADYVYRTFQDISAELKNQNLLLKIGKGSFKEFTNIAQDLNSYQKGYNDLTDKKFIKIKNSLAAEKEELKFVVDKLNASKKSRNVEIDSLNRVKNRSTEQNKRLKELQKENELLFNAQETLKSGIPILEKEFNLTKKIADTRKDLGGLAQAAGKTISQYGGSLANFLNINEATEAVEEYNKEIIQGALSNKKVQDELLKREKAKILAQKMYNEGKIDEARYNSIVNRLEKESYDIKEKAIASTNNLGNKFKSLGVFVKELGVGLKKSLTDPVTIITFFTGKALEANKQVVELGKQLGYGAGRADIFRERIAGIARASGNINVTTENLVQSFGELAQATGFAYEFTADQLITQTKLTKQIGLQADEAAQIQRFAVLNGKTSEETYRSFVRGLTAARNQLRVGINFKAVLAEASKVSGQLAANLGNNPEMIAKAVVTAKAFGMTLEQVAAAGDKLLDFGGSIESELKAELLLGKQINLERARAAALAGDQVTLTEELAKNIGTAAEFTKLNRLQQNALAESVGMTSDQLAETLRKREEALASGKSLAQVQEEEAAQALERQAVQDKFNQAILKLQDLVGNLVAGPFGMLLDLLSNMLGVVDSIGRSFGGVTGILLGMIPILSRASFIARVFALKGFQGAIAAIFRSFAMVPFGLGIPLAIAAVAGLSSLFSQKGDDVMSEGGYGKRTLLAPEGAIKLNDKDTVLAGTDLGGGDGGGTMPSIDLTPMIAAINEVRAAVDRLYNKDTSINMDGKKVGSTLVQGSYKAA